jgi:hypothetical protein
MLSLPAAATGTAGVFVACTMAKAVAAHGAGEAPTLAAARSGAVSLVRLTPASQMRLKKVRELLAPGGDALSAAFAELEALEKLAPAVRGAVAEGGDAADVVLAKVAELPEGVRTCRDFARGMVGLACAAALADAGGDAGAVTAGLGRVALQLRAIVGHAEAAEGADEDAVGAHCLGGAQLAVFADDERPANAFKTVFAALAAPAPPAELPVIKAGGFRAWRAAAPFALGAPVPKVVAEPVGREDALAEVEEVLAGLPA